MGSKSFRADEAAPSKVYKNITPDDTTVYVGVRGVYVGTGGNLTTVDNDGNTVLHKNIASGSELAICPTKIKSTGTDALDIVLYF